MKQGLILKGLVVLFLGTAVMAPVGAARRHGGHRRHSRGQTARRISTAHRRPSRPRWAHHAASKADWSAHGRANTRPPNAHPAEGWKWTHKGPHIVTRERGHVR
jgi:hypothetical protein